MFKLISNAQIDHLSDEQRRSLVEDFFAKDVGLSKVKLSKYGLSSYRTGMLPLIEIDYQESCVNCGAAISRYVFITRTKFKNDNLPPFDFKDKELLRRFIHSDRCDCGHIYGDKWCECESCKLEREERDSILKEEARKKAEYEINWKKDLIKKEYDREIACVPFSEIKWNLHKVFAFFLTDFIGENDLISFEIEDKIFPANFFNKNVNNLIAERILKISPLSSMESFIFENGKIKGFYIFNVLYEFNVTDVSLCLHKHDIFSGALDILNEIKIYECLEYFDYQAEKINLVFEHSKKLLAVIDDLLVNFEVEQIYSLIYSSAKQIAYKMTTERVQKTHAYHLWVCILEKMGNNAAEYSWNVKSYERPFECRKSMIKTFVEFLIDKCKQADQES